MSNKKNGNGKKGNKSNRDDFDSGKKVSASKPNKIPRKQRILAELAETNPKVIGIKPDYTPRKNVAAIEKVLTGTPAEMAKVILEGSHIGLVRLHDDGYDVTFRVTTEEMHGIDFIVVYIHEAKSGVLAGLSGNKTFVTFGQLHASYFKSNLTAGTTNYGIQMKMFHFLQSIFYQVGLLTVAKPKKVEQPTRKASAVKQPLKADPFENHRKAYAKAEKVAIPMMMDEIHGEYEVFGLTIRVGKHPKYDQQKANGEKPMGTNFLTIVRSGGELCKLNSQPRLSFFKLVFGSPETDNIPEDKYKPENVKAIAFLRSKLAKEIAFKHAEKDGLIQKNKPTQTSDIQLGIAVASQFQTLHLNGGEPGVYGRCHGSNSTHQKV